MNPRWQKLPEHLRDACIALEDYTRTPPECRDDALHTRVLVDCAELTPRELRRVRELVGRAVLSRRSIRCARMVRRGVDPATAWEMAGRDVPMARAAVRINNEWRIAS